MLRAYFEFFSFFFLSFFLDEAPLLAFLWCFLRSFFFSSFFLRCFFALTLSVSFCLPIVETDLLLERYYSLFQLRFSDSAR